jgi:hypothetical protein
MRLGECANCELSVNLGFGVDGSFELKFGVLEATERR